MGIDKLYILRSPMLIENLEKLAHFVGVVQARSIRRYALDRRLSQSAVSKCMQNLESALEASLLIRGREGIELTPQGRELLEFAESVLARAQQVESRIRAQGTIRIEGTLTMGAYPSISVYFVPYFLGFLRKSQSGLRLSLASGSSPDLIKALRAGKLDFTISVNPPVAPDLVHTELFRDTYSLYRRVGTRDGGAPIFVLPEAADLEGQPVLRSLQSPKLLARFSPCGDFETIKSMVDHGIGYGLMPDRVAAPLLENGRIELAPEFPAARHIGQHRIAVSCRKHRAGDAALQWISRQLLSLLKSR